MIFMMIPPRRRRHVQVGPVALTVTVWPGGGARLRVTHCSARASSDSDSDRDSDCTAGQEAASSSSHGHKFSNQLGAAGSPGRAPSLSLSLGADSELIPAREELQPAVTVLPGQAQRSRPRPAAGLASDRELQVPSPEPPGQMSS